MKIYTDGSAHPNPGPGGYGVVVCDDDDNIIYCYSKQYEHTTNNEMELKAILYAIINFGKNYGDPIVYSDSSYAINTFTQWMFMWQHRGWLKSDNQVPENLELIKAYYQLREDGYRIDLQKVKGHKGILGNEIADKLATNKMTPDEVMKKYGKKVI